MVRMGRRDHGPNRARRTVPAVGLALALTMALGPVQVAQARPDPDAARKAAIDQQLGAAKDDLADTSAQLTKAYAALSDTTAQLPGARARVAAAEGAVSAADARHAEAAAALAVAQANEAKAEGQLAATRSTIGAARRDVAGFASQIYQEQGAGQIGVALQATSPADFADRLEMVGTIMAVQQRFLDTLATAQADQTAQEAHLSALRADGVVAKKRAADALAAATVARNDAAAAQADLEALAARQQRAAATFEAEKAADLKRLNSLSAESDRLGRVLAERARRAKLEAARQARLKAAREKAARDAARKAHQAYKPPVEAPQTGFHLSHAIPGAPITSEFGMRFHPIYHVWRLHSGMDFGAPCGTPIYAAADGQVIMSAYGWNGGYGNRVVIDHGIHRGVDLTTTYNHMERIAATGGHIKRGQLVGYEGTTGTSTGCHLHFETRENGVPTNPRNWL